MSTLDIIEQAETELVNEGATFFAPATTDLLSPLLGRYQFEREKVERIAEVMNSDEYSGAVRYFLDGNAERDRSFGNVASMFSLEGAIWALNSSYWAQALSLTDVYDCMPQARRDLWNAQIRGEKYVSGRSSYGKDEPVPPLPDFEEATVRNSIAELLQQRSLYFAERVDGIFRGLSSEHLTNQPQGFSTRMIIGYMLSYGTVSDQKAGLIHDLRGVIAKLTGRDAPKHMTSYLTVRTLEKMTGQWLTLDGGSLRIRLYKKGTAHLEVHPDIAWQLNRVLASLHPMAIPAEFRVRPRKRAKEFVLHSQPLPFATLEILSAGVDRTRKSEFATTFWLDHNAKKNSTDYKNACDVLAALGGIKDKTGFEFTFDYPINPVVLEVILSGSLPDQKTHQFYPTPIKLATIAVEMADPKETDEFCEPSAGQGGISDLLPKERTTCVEVSPLHCAVLKAKGYKTVETDFLKWADSAPKFDVIVMNPPYSEGRAKLHTEAASGLIKPAGRLVSILPANLRGNDFLGKGWEVTWSPVFTGEFAGTGVSVVIMKAVRCG